MGKLLSWIVIGGVGYLAWRLTQVLQRKALAARAGQGYGQGRAPAPPRPAPRELMRQCEVCGTHVPDSDALRARGRFYCCAAHRDQAA
ncbi:MAG: PP0621 family protein [Burkholderiaceae bacterium]